MMTWKRIWVWAGPLAVLAVACGGAAAPTATPASRPAPTATVAQPTAAPAQATPTRPAAAQPTAAPTPVTTKAPEDSITLAVSVLPSNVDCAIGGCGGNHYVFQYAHYDRLLKRDFQGKLVNMLATEWSVTPDGLHYTFKVRQGVKFHNGDPLTAEDV